MKINPVNLDFIYFKSKLGVWIFTIQFATRLTFSVMFELPKKRSEDNTMFLFGGDFNIYLDTKLDADGGNPKLKVNSLTQLEIILE